MNIIRNYSEEEIKTMNKLFKKPKNNKSYTKSELEKFNHFESLLGLDSLNELLRVIM